MAESGISVSADGSVVVTTIFAPAEIESAISALAAQGSSSGDEPTPPADEPAPADEPTD